MTTAILTRFAQLVKRGLRQDEPAFRRAYLRLIVEEIVVTAEAVTIRGSRAAP